jgi:hypothetical protein
MRWAISVARNIILLFCMRILDAQIISPTPGFLQDVGGQIPVPEQFSFEPQFQLGMQGNSGNGNPFAYTHGLQFRPWIHYDGVPNLTVTGAVNLPLHRSGNQVLQASGMAFHELWHFEARSLRAQCYRSVFATLAQIHPAAEHAID